MDSFEKRDELTNLEKRVYKVAAFVLIASSVYVMVLIRTARLPNTTVLNMIELALLSVGVAFGWGIKKMFASLTSGGSANEKQVTRKEMSVSGLSVLVGGGFTSWTNSLNRKPFDNSYKKARRSYETKDDEENKS